MLRQSFKLQSAQGYMCQTSGDVPQEMVADDCEFAQNRSEQLGMSECAAPPVHVKLRQLPWRPVIALRAGLAASS
jgi:hypothetical protein